MPVELRHLRYFVALADTLSFTRAAESLYVSQSTLSQQVAALEKELGCKLFERNRRSVALTDAGRALLGESRDILAKVERLEGIAHGAVPDTAGMRTLHVGFDTRVQGSDLLRDAITDRIYELRVAHPDLHVDFASGEYDGMRRALEDGLVDVAFFLHQQPTPGSSDGLVSRCLYEDEIVLAVRTPERVEDTPAYLHRVLAHRGVTLLEGEGRGMLQAVKVFEELGIEPKIRFAADRAAMRMSLNCGEGAAVMPMGPLAALASPDVQALRFHTQSARLYVLAAWNETDTHPLVGEVVGAVEDALAPWVERRRRELAEGL